jgi:hypothetical protein
LVLAVKEVVEGERLVAARALEEVGLVNLDHGQGAALGGEDVASVGEVFFFGEEGSAGGEPLFAVDDLVLFMVSVLLSCVELL